MDSSVRLSANVKTFIISMEITPAGNDGLITEWIFNSTENFDIDPDGKSAITFKFRISAGKISPTDVSAEYRANN